MNAAISEVEADGGMDAYIEQVAAAQPAPGGGSVAALAGALAAALGEMMAGLTSGRGKYASAESQALAIHARLTSLRAALRALVWDDPAAYGEILQARRLPRGTDRERSDREAAVQAAIRHATLTPLQTARAACEVLQCLQSLMQIGNPNVRCDLAVGALLAQAAIRGARYNVHANTALLKDAVFAAQAQAEATDLVRKGEESLKQIDSQVLGN